MPSTPPLCRCTNLRARYQRDGGCAETGRPDKQAIDFFGEVAGRGIAAHWVFIECLDDDRVEIAANLASCDRGQLADEVPESRLRSDPARRSTAAAIVDAFAGQQFTQQHAERIDIGRGRDRSAVALLWCGIGRREGRQLGPVAPSSSASSLAIPKSSSLTSPSAVTRTFDGLRSRCTIRARCAASTARQTTANRCRRWRRSRPCRRAWSVIVTSDNQFERDIGQIPIR